MDTNMLSIGQYRNRTVYFNYHDALNKHMLILGKTGSGKSVKAQQIVLELIRHKKTVLILDIHSVAAKAQIFPAFRDKFEANTHEVNAYHDGISCQFFSPAIFEDGEPEHLADTASAIVEAVSHCIRLGSKQRNVLRKAVINVIENCRYEEHGFQVLDDALKEIGTEAAEDVREKIYPLTAHNIFRSGNFFIEQGKINIVRLSKFDFHTQEMVAELLLSYLWHLSVVSNKKDNELFIMLDECQNLFSGERCVLNQILAEGRKFDMNLILITQQLLQNATSPIWQKLTQSGLLLLFQPGKRQINNVAKLINPVDTKDWALILSNLKKGECIALGTLAVGSVPIDKALKIDSVVNG